jgi:excinuclease ABC subunit C
LRGILLQIFLLERGELKPEAALGRTDMDRESLLRKVRGLPDRPGVYLMHDEAGKIIYVGKAKSLNKRVSSYFRHANFASPRLRKLVASISDLSTIRTETEAEALILESKLIKFHQPFFNVELKMGDRYPYVKVTQERYPRILVTRHKENDGGIYVGPYIQVGDLREMLRLAERHFPLRSCSRNLEDGPSGGRPCVKHALGRCMAPCAGLCSEDEYRRRAADVLLLLQGNAAELVERLRARMEAAAKRLAFEEAARLRDTIRAIWRVRRQRTTSPPLPGERDPWVPLVKLRADLDLPLIPWRIDGFDISHTGGGETVGVAVVFEQGLPAPHLYRRFNLREIDGNDDFRALRETVRRRYERVLTGQEPLPQLILIDGGPQQLVFAEEALRELGLSIPVLALAKREEEVYLVGEKAPLRLDRSDSSLLLLERVRDETHRFAVSSHRARRDRRLRRSRLEDIPGIGKKTAARLLTRFGSAAAVAGLTVEELAREPRIGPILAERILHVLKGEEEA